MKTITAIGVVAALFLAEQSLADDIIYGDPGPYECDYFEAYYIARAYNTPVCSTPPDTESYWCTVNGCQVSVAEVLYTGSWACPHLDSDPPHGLSAIGTAWSVRLQRPCADGSGQEYPGEATYYPDAPGKPPGWTP